MVWSSPQTWTTGMRLSGSTLTSGFNVQLTGNLTAARNLWDNAIHLSLSANYSIPNNSNTSVVWDRKDWQHGASNSSIWAVASGSRMKVTVAGRWEAAGVLEWRPDAAGRREVTLETNDSFTYMCGAQAATFASGNPINMPFGDILSLTTSDYVEVKAYQNTGTSLSLHGGKVDRSRVSWRFLGAAS